MKLRQMRDNIRRERSRQITLTVTACTAALLFGLMQLPVWEGISRFPLHPTAWSNAAAAAFLCNAGSLVRRTVQHKPERSLHIALTCLAVLMTLFYGVFLIEGLLGIPPMLPKQ